MHALKPNTVKKRSYNNFNENEFLKDIIEEDFIEVINTNNLGQAASNFSHIFTKILDKHAPIKTFQQHKNYVPFLSKETKIAMKNRDELKKKATTENNSHLFAQYKLERNMINWLIM